MSQNPVVAPNWETETEAEAAARYGTYRSRDPFPDIAPALLNSADIVDYVRETGLFRPFDFNNLKPASYEIPFLGTWIYWPENRDAAVVAEIQTPEDTVTMERNQIAFVSPYVTFQVPDYLALRFNLRINHIHRGLLLGTGPLIDPGFVGRLLIPLHNLTANEYVLRGGEGLVWVEFTKLSHNRSWRRDKEPAEPLPRREGEYQEFPEKKRDRDPTDYLAEAHLGPIRSNVPEAFKQAQRVAKDAADAAKGATQSADELRSRTERWGVGILLGFVLALAAVFGTVISVMQDSVDLIEETQRKLRELGAKGELTRLEDRIEGLEEMLRKRGMRIGRP